MKRALIVVFVLAALAGTFTFGLYWGINMGIEEYAKFHPVVVPIPCPAPTSFGFSS